MKLNKIFTLLLLIFVSAVFATTAFAANNRDKKPIQLQIGGGLPLGTGASIGYHVVDFLYAGGESYSLLFEIEDKLEEEKVTFDLKTSQLIVRLSPFKSSGFFLQGGYVSRDWKAEWYGADILEDNEATTTDWARVTLKWPDNAVNIGLGGAWIWDSGFSLALTLGQISGGAPTVEVEEGTGAVGAAEVEKERKELEDEAASFKDVGYAALTFGWNF